MIYYFAIESLTWKLLYQGKGAKTLTMPDGWKEATVIMPGVGVGGSYYATIDIKSVFPDKVYSVSGTTITTETGYSFNQISKKDNTITLVNAYFNGVDYIDKYDSYVYYR